MKTRVSVDLGCFFSNKFKANNVIFQKLIKMLFSVVSKIPESKLEFGHFICHITCNCIFNTESSDFPIECSTDRKNLHSVSESFQDLQVYF